MSHWLKGLQDRPGKAALQPFGSDAVTPERKVMLLLRALHERNFKRLRLSAGVFPSGLHRRYGIAPADSFELNGAMVKSELYAHGAFRSAGGESPPFKGGEQPTSQSAQPPSNTLPCYGVVKKRSFTANESSTVTRIKSTPGVLISTTLSAPVSPRGIGTSPMSSPSA